MTTLEPGPVAADQPEPQAIEPEPPGPAWARWLVWLLQVLVAGAALFALADGRPASAIAAAVALAATFTPWLLPRAFAPVPRLLELTFVLGVALIGVSVGFGLFDRVVHWGKLVHAAEGFAFAALSVWLLLGGRDRLGLQVPTQLAAAIGIFLGITFGVFWEFIEFVLDWVRFSDLQKSNTDTMTDFLWADLGTVLGALLAVRLFCHWQSAAERRALGVAGSWLVDGPSRLLDRHGWLMTLLVTALIALTIAVLWFVGRPIPGLGTS
jgi:hypothetical protein